jgi:CHAD domain-containing protein
MNEDEEVVIDSGTSLLIETLETRWKTYRNELKRCQKEPSEEAIHDLRVVTRRLLALVDMLRAVSPHPRFQKMRRTFKDQLDNLDDLRDTQVMLMEVSETVDVLPELTPFQEYLTKREKRFLRSTAKEIKLFKSRGFRKRIDSTHKALLKKKGKGFQQEILLQIVDDAYEAALRRYRRIEPTQPGTIHRLRIAFKKFRYMVEIVHPLVPDFPEDNFEHMHAYQGMMGDIQDLEILLAAFQDFADNDTSYNLEPVHQFYQQRHTEVVNAFIKGMHQINTFWRPKAESDYPWQTKQRRKKSGITKKTSEPLPEEDKGGNREQAEAEQEAQK